MPSEGWANGSTRQWRKTRALVLQRDGNVCQLRIPEVCTYKATCVHHVIGKRHGDNPADLVASCQACNLKVGDPEAGTKDPVHHPHTAW